MPFRTLRDRVPHAKDATDAHNHDDLSFLLKGMGGGTVTGNRHLVVDHVPTNNMWLSMLDRVGAGVTRLGDSTGRFALS